MSISDALAKLLEQAGSAPHEYRTSLLTFAELDVERLKLELQLTEKGAERGAAGEPQLDSADFDAVEHAVVTRIETERKRAHQELLDASNVYRERMHALDFEGRVSVIQNAALNGLSQYKAEVDKGLDRLHGLRRHVQALESDVDRFRADNKLHRTAHYPSLGMRTFYVGLALLLFLIETVINGQLLAKANALGFVGGWIEALTISTLNIGAGFMLGRLGVPNIVHIKPARRMIGSGALLGYLGFLLVLNIFVAHYRDASGQALEHAGRLAWESFHAHPLGLGEFQSWVLVGIGALFSLISFLDGIHFDDPYPGYGPLHRRLEVARADYIAERQHLIDELQHIKDECIDAMESAKRDLTKRRAEHRSLIDGCTRVVRSFSEHMNYLERVGNSLLGVYREANRAARGGKAPKRFNESWIMERPHVEETVSQVGWPTERLDSVIEAAETNLSERIHQVHDAFAEAVRSYERLDSVVEGDDGAARAA
jgi:hypothetical protein